ncbi:MAG: Ig-like domain-containing protein, partial [Bryobacteraceae bacterium]
MRVGRSGLFFWGAVFALVASNGWASQCPTAGSCQTSGNTTTCTSTDAISTPDEGNNGSLYTANIYPSCVTVPSGVTGTVASVQVQLTNVDSNGSGNYFSVQATEILLESPSGAQLELLGGPGDGSDTMTGLTMLIGNGAGFNPMPNGNPAGFPASGTQDYEPSSYLAGYGFGVFPSPGPGDVQNYPQTQGTATLASVFASNGGVTAAGAWKLWMIDNLGNPVTVNGWELILTVNESEVGTTTVVSSGLNPSYTSSPNSSVTFTATVTSGGNPVTAGGTVAFYLNGSGTPISCGSGNQTLNGSGQATCGTTLSSQGFNSIVAKYSGSGSYSASTSAALTQLVEVHQAAPSEGTPNTWCNSAAIPVLGNITPQIYPSIINVSGYSGNPTVGNVTVELEGATGPDGVPAGFLLVAPNGQNLDFLDIAFGYLQPASPVNLTIFDTAGQTPNDNDAPSTGNYEPFDGNTNPQDPFPATTPTASSIDSNIPAIPGTINYSAPRGGVNALNFGEAIGGAPANGDWALYIYSYSGENVTLNNGWCITFDINPGAGTTTVVTSSQQQATTGQSVTISATVTSGSSPVTSGTVTFVDTTEGTTLASDVAVNGSGVAQYTTTSFTEGDHKITATYNGTSTYNTSFGTMWQREDDATAVTAVNSSTWQFCNPGAVEISASGSGPYTPNPSNIFATNLPGTLASMSLTLNSLSIGATAAYETASLIEGPTGAALDFFSNNEGGNEVYSGTYTFADGNPTVPFTSSGTIAPGTYEPTAYLFYTGAVDKFTSSPSGFYNVPSFFDAQPISPFYTFNTGTRNVFKDTNPIGTWSLFFNQYGVEGAVDGAAGGWCMNFTENPVAVTAATESTDSFTQGQQGATFTLNITNNGT